ncbi:hypothetical protein BTJ40_17375 [Microbulbifer sp. A4B17]|uniref:hypothetical protein n=1 Tax=Microbulbifer sp. A4B17 TaxID=359370 RepID=UPI000D52CC0C|nr:hypothetical protein [Microbulbifer sp. A4B17]AWF82448.1 hypothetical protein BTJ40_17375 [Microbulbifer sp. A4B17]
MSNRKDYPYNEAIDDLEIFFKKNIKNQESCRKFLDYLGVCRKNKRLGFRYVHEELMKYRKEYSDYFMYTPEEREMIDDLLYFWG